MSIRSRVKAYLRTLLISIILPKEGPEEATSAPERERIHINARPEKVLDLVVLADLRHEGTLKASLWELTVWSGLEEATVELLLTGQTAEGPLWQALLDEMRMSHSDRSTLRKALMTLVKMNPEESITDTVDDVVKQQVARAGKGDTEKDIIARRVIMDRYYLYQTLLVDPLEN